MKPVHFVILGEPASKANSRELVTVGPADKRRMLFRKSDKALGFEEAALLQIPPAARLRLEADVVVVLRIFYASRRPDLDESVVLDVLQDRWSKPLKDRDGTVYRPRQLVQAGVYRNDRQVREKHVYWGLDPKNPRTEVIVQALEPEQAELLPAEDPPAPAPMQAPPETTVSTTAGRWADQIDPKGVPF